jgi:CRP/FNR family cyclic AMP-dependent transcriptional regulator
MNCLTKINPEFRRMNMAEQTLWSGSFLDKFSPRVQEKILALAEPFRFKAGQDIIGEGDSSLYLYIVKSGRVAVEIYVPPKGRCMIRTGGAGDMFSWSALVEPCRATAAVRAIEDTEAFGIRGRVLADECRKDHELGFELYRALTEVIAGRLNATRLQLVNVYAVG